jgi:hypothetical protein
VPQFIPLNEDNASTHPLGFNKLKLLDTETTLGSELGSTVATLSLHTGMCSFCPHPLAKEMMQGVDSRDPCLPAQHWLPDQTAKGPWRGGVSYLAGGIGQGGGPIWLPTQGPVIPGLTRELAGRELQLKVIPLFPTLKFLLISSLNRNSH